MDKNVHNPVINFDGQRDVWALAIGEFIYDSACIEDLLLFAIESYLRDTVIKEKHLKSRFEDRLDLFGSLVIKFSTDIGVHEQTFRLIQDLKNLRNIRNLIAHNGLGMVLGEDSDGDFQFIGFEICSNKSNAISLTYAGLIERVAFQQTCLNELKKVIEIFVAREAEWFKSTQ